MDFWKSEYEGRESTPVLAGLQELVDSPNLSSNSIEYSSDSLASDQTENSKATLTPKTTLLAKKRLQAYYTVNSVNKLRVANVKEQKNDNVSIEKTPKPSFKKVKQTIYPGEAAKAVIRDIEILKRAGYGYGPKGPSPALPSDIIVPTDPIVPISLLQIQNDSPAISLMSEEDNMFKRREIKCRNIRKSGLSRRRSVSPKSKYNRSDSRKKEKKAYPLNWTEYKEMELNTQKNVVLKSKLLKNPKDKKFELKRYFNFQTHPVPIEIYKSNSKTGDTVCVPFPYLRCTASKPQILYSTNQRVTSPGYLTREQLFSLIPKERKVIIEKLGKSSRCEADNKTLTARKWYPKNWKKTDNTEAKLLENSVGLSFLQSYSDEEEEEDTFQVFNQETVSIIEEIKQVGFVDEKKDISILKDEFEFPQEKELSPSATPKTVPSNFEENLVDEELQETIKTKKSRWDDPSNTTEPNYDKTPPIDVEQEEGEVVSEEEQKNREKCAIDEYEKTKEELEKLEAVLKSSTTYLDSVSESKEIATKSEDNKKIKKKRKKVPGDKISKSKNQKKKSRKKVEKKNRDRSSGSSDPSESEEDKPKKKRQKKRKKDSKTKSEKDKKRKTKKKKNKKEKTHISSEKEEEFDEVSGSENNLPKKKKKGNKIEKGKIRKRTVSGDSRHKAVERKSSLDTTQEDYEDDIKFFAARFDAENKLKGKTKHKTKTNITLEELAVHPKIEEKTLKRKFRAENSESEGLLSPETAQKKTDQQKKNKDKAKLAEESAKKEEIKVDLLKMNEDYLREQKRKEERESFLPSEGDDGQDSKKNKHLPKENCKEKIKTDTKSENEMAENVDEEPAKTIIDLDKSDEETVETVLENIIVSDTSNYTNTNADKSLKENSHPDWETIRNKRKRMSAGAGQEKSEKKPKHSLSPEIITLINIKQENDTGADGTIEKNNSWESDEDLLDLEIPLNIKPFCRREIKLESDDVSNPEDHPQEQPDLVLAEEDITNQLDQPPADVVEFQLKTKRIEEVECIDLECDVQTPPKRTRWDIKASASTPTFKLEKPDEIIDVDANNSNNCITLENEYEEFMKAVTSTKKESVIVDSNSDSSLIFVEDIQTVFKEEVVLSVNNLEELSPIPTIQIPLPPVKSEQIKPVPVPSPKLEAVLDLNKPLINLSLSANVTQNITLSLATSVPSISAPITSSIDISQPCVEISAPLMNDIPISTTSYAPLVADSAETDSILLVKDEGEAEEEGANQKLVFTSLTLPSKKLLDNSKLNLGDSDNDDQNTVEELKRKKLEALIEDNKREALYEQAIVPVAEGTLKARSPISKQIANKEESFRRTSPHRSARRAETSPKRGRRESSPSVRRARDSPVRRRDPSPRRRSSPVRRKSPRRSPKRRSPVRRKKSPARRSISPRRRRASISPRRRRSPSPKRKRSPSPKSRHSPSRLSPRSSKRTGTSKDTRLDVNASQRKPSGRHRETSPLKRSVADSTISDDQLPQPNADFSDSVLPKQLEKEKSYQSPKRVPLDVRISQVLGYEEPSEASPKSTAQFYHHNEPPQLQQQQQQQQQPQHQQYQFNEEQYSSIQSQVTTPTMRNAGAARTPQSTYRQVGNMLQIVPTDNLTDIPMPRIEMSPDLSIGCYPPDVEPIRPAPQQHGNLRSKILQVGNMLQIVPTEMVPTESIPVPPESIPVPPVHTEIKTENIDDSWMETSIPASPEKPSAEASMLLKVAERRAERENRRQEREKRRKEKERRRKEKEKERQAKLKVKTENMIKRALELEQEEEEEDVESDTLGEQHVQWPPIPIVVNHTIAKEVGRSILVNSYSRQLDEPFLEERKSKAVQFADGIRPGEGTSPSAGEDLSSPPPPKRKLPKEKRFKKMKFGKKSAKKKVKVKIIKKPPSPLGESDSDDLLPPPSPPPGSPPSHVFPPRIKVNPVNNVPSAYLASIIQTAQQQQQQPQQQQQQQQAPYPSNLYRTPISLMMAPPPPPQGHLSSVPSHVQSPHGAAMPPALSPQTHYHPGMNVPPPPPPPPHSTGSARQLWDQDGMPIQRYRPRT